MTATRIQQRDVESDAAALEYRGRIAPTPTGFLHLGHARTFWIAQQRAAARNGRMILRIEDLDPQRSREQFVRAAIEDLSWFGLRWDEGPNEGDGGGEFFQSFRIDRYRAALDRLIEGGRVYRCYCSRKDVQAAGRAPHLGDEGILYPGTCRGNLGREAEGSRSMERSPCWRFRIGDGRRVTFHDGYHGEVGFTAGDDFGDFVVWRYDGIPSYQLAVTVDDHEMGISEVVRGDDLLVSACRQILLYEALGWPIPEFFHCPLMTDENGERLAKRSKAMGIRDFRARGWSPEQIRSQFGWNDLGIGKC